MRADLFRSLRRSVISNLRHSFPKAQQHDVDDAVSSAIESYLLDAPEHVKSCERRTNAWLLTTAWRMLRRERLRGKRYAEISESFPSHTSLDTSAAHLTESLNGRSREIVHLHSFDGLKPREIASVLGCSVNAVNMHLKRAYRELRASLRRDYAVLKESYYFWLSTFKTGYAFESAMLEVSFIPALPI